MLIDLPGCSSLKEKRGLIHPIIACLHRQFNLSVAEVGYQDHWSKCQIACVVVSNDAVLNTQILQQLPAYLEEHYPSASIIDFHIESR